ncbi:ferritin-like domain-containing protein [Geodermatophilus sp. DSM 44513]|uniref:ferritin-like domain-containing protein n=1 Tax=Geodermatophilus sp. DSM 44513 TaxID=1528104 RepID=UPI0012875F49|nr:ferritin-like domain-containing protein [Geodermatophilus sp. DSM 44513]WNV74425.1 ferritin-like domain-containing protein [Geodermatophilus sp. DSM 44513]
MADDGPPDEATETTALREVLAAEHAAVWGYGTVGAALPEDGRGPAVAADTAHRDVRDRVVALLAARGAEPVPRAAGYALPFPVLSAVDAATLAVVLEEGVSAAWVRLLDRSVQATVRGLAVAELGAAEARAVGWRAAAGRTPLTDALPGLPPA